MKNLWTRIMEWFQKVNLGYYRGKLTADQLRSLVRFGKMTKEEVIEKKIEKLEDLFSDAVRYGWTYLLYKIQEDEDKEILDAAVSHFRKLGYLVNPRQIEFNGEIIGQYIEFVWGGKIKNSGN